MRNENLKSALDKYRYDALKPLFDEGREYGRQDIIEEIRLLRYAKEESADPLAVETLTELLNKLQKKEFQK